MIKVESTESCLFVTYLVEFILAEHGILYVNAKYDILLDYRQNLDNTVKIFNVNLYQNLEINLAFFLNRINI